MFYSILPCSWGSTSLDKLAFITDNGMPPKNWNAGTDKKSEKFINKYTSRNYWIISEPYYQLGMSFWDIPNTYIGLRTIPHTTYLVYIHWASAQLAIGNLKLLKWSPEIRFQLS